MARHWLFKEEPSHYSFEEMLRDRRTVWDGVRNNLALKHLRQVKKGDEVIFYHTGEETSATGIMRATSDPYPDPKEKDQRLVVVDVEPVRKLKRPVSLSSIKSNPKFSGFELLRIPRLSVMEVPPGLWKEIMALAESG